MRCFNCNNEINPTLIYCSSCGVPLETDVADIMADEERRVVEARELKGKRWAKDLFVLALFLLGCTIATRAVLLDEQRYDDFVGFRMPADLVEEAAVDPPMTVEVDTLAIPLPEGEPDAGD